jgi:Mpv17 / PMP22 family
LEHILHRQQKQLRLIATDDNDEEEETKEKDDTIGSLQPQPYNQPHSVSSSLYTTLSIHGRYDIRRGISTLMDGLFISGPLMHVGYDLFESILPINSASTGSTSTSDTCGWIAAMFHVIADSVLLDSFFVASKFFTTGLMEGITAHDLLQQFYATYIPSLQASWITSILLCPIQLSCFCYLPLSFRVLSVNVIDVVWDAVLSFMTHRSR